MIVDDGAPRKLRLAKGGQTLVSQVQQVHAIASTGYPGDATDGHPTKEQHLKIVNDLLPQVRAIMRW